MTTLAWLHPNESLITGQMPTHGGSEEQAFMIEEEPMWQRWATSIIQSAGYRPAQTATLMVGDAPEGTATAGAGRKDMGWG